MTEPRKPKRITVQPKRDNQVTVVAPSLENLMSDALYIISNELAQYKSKTKRQMTLELKEARAVQGYLDALVKLSREERERAKEGDFSDLTDEELRQLMIEVHKAEMDKEQGSTGDE